MWQYPAVARAIEWLVLRAGQGQEPERGRATGWTWPQNPGTGSQGSCPWPEARVDQTSQAVERGQRERSGIVTVSTDTRGLASAQVERRGPQWLAGRKKQVARQVSRLNWTYCGAPRNRWDAAVRWGFRSGGMSACRNLGPAGGTWLAGCGLRYRMRSGMVSRQESTAYSSQIGGWSDSLLRAAQQTAGCLRLRSRPLPLGAGGPVAVLRP